jgi:type II secretion system protein J
MSALRQHRSARRASSRRGFTLIEVMIAIGILVVIAALAFETLSGAVQSRDMLEENDELSRSARVAIQRLSREISLAFLTTNTSAVNTYRTLFVGKDSDEADQLWFATTSHRRTYHDAREGDQTEITLWTEADPEDDQHLVLLHREAPRIDQEPDKDGTILPLARGVARFDLRYLDGEKNEWKDEWDTTGAETPGRLPRAVQVLLVLVTPDDDNEGQWIEHPYLQTILIETAKPIKKSLFNQGQKKSLADGIPQ